MLTQQNQREGDTLGYFASKIVAYEKKKKKKKQKKKKKSHFTENENCVKVS